MDRSPRTAPSIFLVGCLSILLVVAIQMWPANEFQRGIDRPIDGRPGWALAGDNIPRLDHDNRPFRLPSRKPAAIGTDVLAKPMAPVEPRQEPQYGATIRAEEALADRDRELNLTANESLVDVVGEPATVIEAPLPTTTVVPPYEDSPMTMASIPEPQLQPPARPRSKVTLNEPPIVADELLELPHSFASVETSKSVLNKSGKTTPPQPAPAITPGPYSAKSASSPWPQVPALKQQLEAQRARWAVRWSENVAEHLDALQRLEQINNASARQILKQLEQLVIVAENNVNSLPTQGDQTDLRRAIYALKRRSLVWNQVIRNAEPELSRRLSPISTATCSRADAVGCDNG